MKKTPSSPAEKTDNLLMPGPKYISCILVPGSAACMKIALVDGPRLNIVGFAK